MAKATFLCALVMCAATSILTAQTDSENKAARERLSYFAGTWNVEMHMKTGALNSHVYFATEHNEWAPNHTLLLSKPEGDTAVPQSDLAVMGYNPSKHAYTYHILKSTGDTEDLQGTMDGETWTWLTDDMRTSAQSTKTRITMTQISPTSYSLRVETFPAGGSWSTIMEGTAKKVVVHSHQDVAFLR
jgi:Protein of unknown function (DUF1579)